MQGKLQAELPLRPSMQVELAVEAHRVMRLEPQGQVQLPAGEVQLELEP